MYDETGDAEKSQGWTPLIVDTNGNGKRDAYVEANQPVDPTKDKRIMAAFYGVQPSPVDDIDLGPGDGRRLLARRPARLHHAPHPRRESERDRARRGLPAARRRLRLARHRPRPQRRRVDGAVERPHGELRPQEVQRPAQRPGGRHRQDCPEGWTLYKFPGPQFKGVTDPGSAEHAYYIWVDRYNTLGLGANVPIAIDQWRRVAARARRRQVRDPARALPDGLLHQERRRPHRRCECRLEGPGPVDDVRHRTVFHNEGGTANSPKLYKLQMRPDPLAN